MIRPYLITLDKLVNEVTNTATNQRDTVALTKPAFTKELAALSQGLYQALDQLVASKQRETVVKRTFRQLQLRCAVLLNKLVSADQPAKQLTLQELEIENTLRCLLTQQCTHFENYFCFGLEAPMSWVNACFLELQQNRLRLIAGLKKQKISDSLQEMLLLVFDGKDLRFAHSYQQLAYLKRLQLALIHFCQKVNNEPFEPVLQTYLIYLNFNYSAFITYLTAALDSDLHVVIDVKAQFLLLCTREQYFTSLPTKHAFGYDENQACAKDQVLNYITSAIVLHQRNAAVTNSFPLKTSSLQLDRYRLRVTISADALAYLLRLLIEAGIIIAEPRSQLLAFVAQHFQTAGIGDELLSANSLGTKYKQVVQRTALNMRTLLKKLTKTIEANFDC